MTPPPSAPPPPDTFFTIGQVYGDYTSAAEAIAGGFRALRNGADAVYCGSSLAFVRSDGERRHPGRRPRRLCTL